MSYLAKRGTHTIKLAEWPKAEESDKQHWIKIRAGKSYAASLEESAAAVKTRFRTVRDENTGATTTEPDMQVDIAASRFSLFKHSIVEWSLTDEDGRLLPMDAVVFVDLIDGEFGDWLADQIATYYLAQEPDPKAGSSGSEPSTGSLNEVVVSSPRSSN